MSDVVETGSDEIFEINDFTVCTEFERLADNIETVLTEWKSIPNTLAGDPAKLNLRGAVWTEETEKLCFNSKKFRLIFYYARCSDNTQTTVSNKASEECCYPSNVAELLNATNDFCSGEIAKYFSVSRYAILLPDTTADVIADEDERNLILSALCVAATNCDWQIPLFVQSAEQKRGLFTGFCQNRNMRTDFDTVHLRRYPPKCANLNGLLDVFKEKLASGSSQISTGTTMSLRKEQTVRVSVRVTYSLDGQFDIDCTPTASHSIDDYDPDLPESNLNRATLLTGSNSGQLLFPFGSHQNPISALRVWVTWPQQTEDMLVENDVYSDLDPVAAPYWHCRALFTRGLNCLTADCIKKQLRVADYVHSTIGEMLGITPSTAAHSLGGHSALSRLTQAPVDRVLPRLGSGESSNTARYLPLDEQIVESYLDAIFDGSKTKEAAVAIEGSPVKKSRSHTDEESSDEFQSLLLAAKSTGPALSDALLSRLAFFLAQVLTSEDTVGGGAVMAMCQLYLAFVRRLRHCWEDAEFIPGIAEESMPDLNTCLLNQKLEMLQCCIWAKRKRMQLIKRTNSDEFLTDDSDGEANDTFYDATDQYSKNKAESGEDVKRAAEGVKGRIGELTLIRYTDRPLNIPITQDSAPLTEDRLMAQIEAHMDVGGTIKHLSTETLSSDMQAFKAANPGAELADFVRWHSPRDWDDEHQLLSDRMQPTEEGDNLWQQVWNEARPIPVSRQKRLFNETNEAEQILQWLNGEVVTVSELITLLLPALFTVALTQIVDESTELMDVVGKTIEDLHRKFAHISKHSAEKIDDYRELVRLVELIEAKCAQFRSLKSALLSAQQNETGRVSDDSDDRGLALSAFVKQLLNSDDGKTVPVYGAANSHIGKALTHLFRSNEHGSFPPYSMKEYVIRCISSRPQPIYSRPTPQRLYAAISNVNWIGYGPDAPELRLCGAFSQDLTFV